MGDHYSESSGVDYTPVNARLHLPGKIEALDALVASSRRNIHTAHGPSRQNLPIELLVRVFEQTDAKTLRHIETACRLYHLIVSRYNIWDKCAPQNITGSEDLGLSRKQVLGLVSCSTCMNCDQPSASICGELKKRLCHACRRDARDRGTRFLQNAQRLATQYERDREARQRECLVRQVLARGVAHKWTKEELEQSPTSLAILYRQPDITDAIWKVLEPQIAEQVTDYRIQKIRQRRSILISTLYSDYIRRVLKTDAPSVAHLMALEETKRLINGNDEESPIPPDRTDVWLEDITKPLVERIRQSRIDALTRLEITEDDAKLLEFRCTDCNRTFDYEMFLFHARQHDNTNDLSPFVLMEVIRAGNGKPRVVNSIKNLRRMAIEKLLPSGLDAKAKDIFFRWESVHNVLCHDLSLGSSTDNGIWSPLVRTLLETFEAEVMQPIREMRTEILTRHGNNVPDDQLWYCLECKPVAVVGRLPNATYHVHDRHIDKTADEKINAITTPARLDEMLIVEFNRPPRKRTFMATKEVYDCRHCVRSIPKALVKFKAHWTRVHKSFQRVATTDDLLLPSESVAKRNRRFASPE
ncbi:hypothetical protein SeMB42_g02107 [Synchytrium endobioticum]|uniref:F-box domain-containing protein n=1 Tax=Synchytrium endobioticum TaxID=286115 RepID=A0A507DIZ6_9FUNG|nr:hypothetical protein SeLEV6574_g02593 [Synchytrium endobioticum]TPX50878.1 hypothetical protein SeMB42_g02107 [Synchytrium endobioticum]